MLARRPLMIVLAAGLALLAGGSAMADETRVAVAANFTEPAKAIAAKFEAKTGHRAILSFGASGQFYTQIANGAPFEVFLSADAERPTRAEAEGLAVAGTRFTYATGRLVLWSTTPGLVDGRGAVLARGKFEKLAIADPKSAPYGLAAVETLTRLKLYDGLKPKVVTGSSITQTYQYVQTGAAELGFVALSQVVNQPGGSRWIVPPANHTPIDQQAVLLKTGAGNPAAKAFLQFLKGAEAKAIIRRYGYEVR
ncbi:molybdate ABC transporter substrate-binding protein [Caulobacter sp. ErkDOM-YI]|uniref:molybdate ABC transporter substrate-binding protein n=1 Tax=unclassified Caulobacter TaxID=2648921 RepID=UPI003AF6F4B2